MGHRVLVGFILGVVCDKALVNVDIDENSSIGTEITRLSQGFKIIFSYNAKKQEKVFFK